MQTKHTSKFVSIILGIIFTLFFISAGLIFTINFRALYYYDIKALNIAKTSGYPVDVIRENYDALIDYCSPFFKGNLSFPTLPASREGLIHFQEVKDIFILFYYVLVITSLLLLIALFLSKGKKVHFNLKLSAITTIVVPLIVAGACMIDFDQTFVIFHKLFFRNDYWLFDPATDPIIELLPSQFFLHCAMVIVLFVFLGALLQYLFYARKNRK